MMSAGEKKAVASAQKTVDQQMRRLAKDHMRRLGNLIGRLDDKFDVEASMPEGFAMRRMPIGINLKDRNVDAPLNDWGSGTQNRTHILMAILQANRIKTTSALDEKVTPFVVIEEPESFLHPSAQAEFGGILSTLSVEFGIQIIATTHSPYMLNKEKPESNILLTRNVRYKKACETRLVEVGGDNWMAPFADHLYQFSETMTRLGIPAGRQI
jgi:putative ATP-dependent endonuclease of the OLD family